MTVHSIGTAAVNIAVHNKHRTLLVITNDHASAKVYIDDKSSVTTTDAKFILEPFETLIFDGVGDYPHRAYWAISDTASTTVIVGDQAKDEEK